MFYLVPTLKYINDIIGGQRFAGMDQNPKGVRDLLGAAISDAERHDKAASAMLAALHSLEAHIGRTDMAWVNMDARQRVDIENRLKERARAAIAAAKAAGIKEKTNAL